MNEEEGASKEKTQGHARDRKPQRAERKGKEGARQNKNGGLAWSDCFFHSLFNTLYFMFICSRGEGEA